MPIDRGQSNKSEAKIGQWLLLCMLCMAALSSSITFSCIVPFFPSVALAKSISMAQVGIVLAISPLIIFVASPLIGRYMDKIGGARCLFSTGLAMSGIGATMFGFLIFAPNGFPFFCIALAIRFFTAVGNACCQTSVLTLAAKHFPAKIGSIMSIIETCEGISYIVGPLLGIALFSLGGFCLHFFTTGPLIMVTSVTSMLIWKFKLLSSSKTINEDNNEKSSESAEESKQPTEEDKVIANTHNTSSKITKSSELLHIIDVWLCLAQICIMLIAAFFYDAGLSEHVKEFDHNPEVTTGIFISILSTVYLLATPICGFLIGRFPGLCPLLMCIGSFCSAVACLMMGPSPLLTSILAIPKSRVIASIAFGLQGFAASCAYVPCFQFCIRAIKLNDYDMTDNKISGFISGLVRSSEAIGSFVGIFVGAICTEYLSFAWTASSVAFLHLTWLVFFLSRMLVSTSFGNCSQ